MNPKKKEQIIQQLTKIASEAEDPHLSEQIFASKTVFGEEGSFRLSDQTIRHYREVATLLLKEQDWGSKFSEEYIYKGIDKILMKAVGSPTPHTVEPLINQLLHDLSSYSDEVTVFVHISGLRMDVETLEIGNITLKRVTEQFMNELATRINSIISTVTNPESYKEFFRNSEKKDIERYKNHTFAEFHVIAEEKRAVERAVDECRRVLDLFWFFVPLSNSGDSRFYISLESIGDRDTPVFCDKKFYTRKRQTAFLPFHVYGDILRAMREMGIFEVGALLKKKDSALTEIERTLMRGIHWYAAARAQTENEKEFLNLVVALEVYLTPKNREPIGAYIAEAVAIILGETLQERIEIKEKIKKLYSMRSGISHGGQKAIADADLIWLRMAIWYLTDWVIRHRSDFRSLSDLHKWIEVRKLGGDSEKN